MRVLLLVLLLQCVVTKCDAEQTMDGDCYGPGAVVGAVIGTACGILVLLGLVYLLYIYVRKTKHGKHLVLETDPEQGRGDKYAFDNPCFKESGPRIPVGSGPESGSKKWYSFYPLISKRGEPERGVGIEQNAGELRTVSLRSQDFIGLGFSVCGNMRSGIYVKDVLQHGPASASGQLSRGDRITSVRISFEHMVYEDALAILSSASPYELQIQVKPGHGQFGELNHPLDKRPSSMDEPTQQPQNFHQIDHHQSFQNSNTLNQNEDNIQTLMKPERTKKILQKTSVQPQATETVESEKQSTENRLQKFGVRVLPPTELHSPKLLTTSENENNVNLERQKQATDDQGVDEVDLEQDETDLEQEGNSFERQNSVTGSGIKRDDAGIPQEIPEHMLHAAVAARKNRKTPTPCLDLAAQRKPKGKAPAPPPTVVATTPEDEDVHVDVIVHQTEVECNKRRTASTGDLSNIDQTEKILHSITLERAQSLDITDTGVPFTNGKKKRKATTPAIQDDDDGDEEQDIAPDADFSKSPKAKEARLSLDIADTFPVANRLKKSSEWGNLEDVIMNLDEADTHEPLNEYPNAVNNILWPTVLNESIEIVEYQPPPALFTQEKENSQQPEADKQEPVVTNALWPTDEELLNGNTSSEPEVLPAVAPPSPPLTTLKDKFQQHLKNKSSESQHPGKSSQNFIFAEKYASSATPTLNKENDVPLTATSKLYDTNVSDDIKVSRHSLGSLERPKSDVLKNVNKLKMQQQQRLSEVNNQESDSKSNNNNNVTITTTTNNENSESFVTEIQITNNSPTKGNESNKSRIPVATKSEPKMRTALDVQLSEPEVSGALISPSPPSPEKNLSKNVTVTSIRTNSKIPFGNGAGAASKPPIPARPDISSPTSPSPASFKQWIFNPPPTNNTNSVTNIVVNNSKQPAQK